MFSSATFYSFIKFKVLKFPTAGDFIYIKWMLFNKSAGDLKFSGNIP